MKNSVEIAVRGQYSLAASAGFLCGFTPAGGTGATLDDGRLALGFLDETTFRPVSVAIAQGDDGKVTFEGSRHLAPQLARILSLDHDGEKLDDIGERDRVVADLVRARPGFRPVCFPSAYEAAVWGVLAQRIPMTMASRIKQKLAVLTGSVAEGFGRTFLPSPSPQALLALDRFEGLPEEKLARLKGVAEAALDGKLEAERLRTMPYEDAHAELRKIRGIGEWTADLVLARGSGLADAMPVSEPRLLRGIQEAYALADAPSRDEAIAIGEGWRPLRTWVCVLVVSSLSPDRWNGPEPRGRKPRGAGLRKAAPSRHEEEPSPRARVAGLRSENGSAA